MAKVLYSTIRRTVTSRLWRLPSPKASVKLARESTSNAFAISYQRRLHPKPAAVGGRSQSADRVAIKRTAHAGAVTNMALAVVTEPFRGWGSPLADKGRDVIYWCFAEVSKLGANVGVSEVERQAVKVREHA
jgi:hypothetical protein